MSRNDITWTRIGPGRGEDAKVYPHSIRSNAHEQAQGVYKVTVGGYIVGRVTKVRDNIWGIEDLDARGEYVTRSVAHSTRGRAAQVLATSEEAERSYWTAALECTWGDAVRDEAKARLAAEGETTETALAEKNGTCGETLANGYPCTCPLANDGSCRNVREHQVSAWAKERDEAVAEALVQLHKAKQLSARLMSGGRDVERHDRLKQAIHKVETI